MQFQCNIRAFSEQLRIISFSSNFRAILEQFSKSLLEFWPLSSNFRLKWPKSSKSQFKEQKKKKKNKTNENLGQFQSTFLSGGSSSSYPSSCYSIFLLFPPKMMQTVMAFVIVTARTSFYIRKSIRTIIHRVVHFNVMKSLFHSCKRHISIASIVFSFMLLHFNSFAIANKSIKERERKRDKKNGLID